MYAIVFSCCLICFQFVGAEQFSDFIKRGSRHSPVEKRTAEDYEKCKRSQSGKKEAEALLVLEGSRLLLTCPLCLKPEANAIGLWQQFVAENASFVPIILDGYRVRILTDLSLQILESKRQDSGIYLCQREGTVHASYAVDIKAQEPHIYVVAKGRNYRDKAVALPDLNLAVVMSWSEWSPCSRCGQVGRMRRVGICSVMKLDNRRPSLPVDSRMLDEFRQLPCRSAHLPQPIRELDKVYSTKSKFVVGFCKIPCNSAAGVVVVTDSSGRVVDTVDKSQGLYSLHQPLPPLPPLVKRRVRFEVKGKSIVLICPGNTEDKFLIWRNDSYVIHPGKVHIRTKGRVKIDFANSLHIRKLRDSDSAIYSCWDDKRLVGTIRLKIIEPSSTKSYRIHVLNIGVLFTFVTIFMIGITACKNARLQTKE